MVAFEGLSSAKSDQAKIDGFRAVPIYEAGAEPQPRMRSFICCEADIVLVDTAGESDPFVHDWCRAWNVVIMRKLWENPTKRWATIIRRRIERSWTIQGNIPSAKQIFRAKMLGR